MTEHRPRRVDRWLADQARLIAPVFDEAGWMWGGPGEDDKRVPIEGEIALALGHLFDMATEKAGGSASSGRLHVYRGTVEDGDEHTFSIGLDLGDIDLAEEEPR